LHHRNGRRGEALAVFHDIRRLLVEEPGADRALLAAASARSRRGGDHLVTHLGR
jgi:hypothetical protein